MYKTLGCACHDKTAGLWECSASWSWRGHSRSSMCLPSWSVRCELQCEIWEEGILLDRLEASGRCWGNWSSLTLTFAAACWHVRSHSRVPSRHCKQGRSCRSDSCLSRRYRPVHSRDRPIPSGHVAGLPDPSKCRTLEKSLAARPVCGQGGMQVCACLVRTHGLWLAPVLAGSRHFTSGASCHPAVEATKTTPTHKHTHTPELLR